MTTTTPPTRRPMRSAAPANSGDWRDDAECRTHPDPDLWHASGEGARSLVRTEEAKRICSTRCAVRDQCLQWALETRQDTGVWGGLSEDERRRLHRRMKPVYRGGEKTAAQHILEERLDEFLTLQAAGLVPSQIAQTLGTNVRTVNQLVATLTANGTLKVVKAA